MNFGSMLKFFRNLRGYTQLELGANVGLNDVRIRQYESGSRTPREDLQKEFAEALDIKDLYLETGGFPESLEEAMYNLFKLDSTYPLKIEEVDIKCEGKRGNTYTKTEYVIHFQDAAVASMTSFLPAWKKMRDTYDNEEITKEEYEDWKANWPSSTNADYKSNVYNNKKIYKYHLEGSSND
ncbi:helix-turn-helix domain-containing protein [Clostridium algidicarnis]|uniref:helix-turn-helix domain-containing protein n=1 Tax=Clostridium algidicarnis TaxID=37659 RepID=UPI001C0CC0CC|nr:helix-turn-helix transcriptional regulator [Clostridium algidicarnis]MBU3209870.1 helix-turn-helix domain-containing protein [Clostridium algidicarnis]